MPKSFLTLSASVLLLASCSGTRPVRTPADYDPLPPCPDSPNCVSSDESRDSHHIDAFDLVVPPEQAWPVVAQVVGDMPRTEIVARTDRTLHAECTTAVFRWVDDLELSLRPERSQIAVRSASRVGYGDMGVNRERVEELRAALIRRGVCR
jgi:uncharacterized protein (DUF1499 family)